MKRFRFEYGLLHAGFYLNNDTPFFFECAAQDACVAKKLLRAHARAKFGISPKIRKMVQGSC